MAADTLATTAFRAMGSSCSIVAAPHLIEDGQRRVEALEQRWSRFISTSDISKLNMAGGQPVAVDESTLTLLEHSVRAWQATDGYFDPTLLPALLKFGYVASRDEPRRQTSLPSSAVAGGNPAGIVVDRTSNKVALPFAMTIDPGGIGKGLAADIVVRELVASFPECGALVEIGGDLSVLGPAPEGAWHVDVWNADRTQALHRVVLREGGIATSTRKLRTWITDEGEPAHHLVDPVTHTPTRNGVAACTVIAGTCGWAEAFTKVAFAAHSTDDAIERLEHRSLAALVTNDDGHEFATTNWKTFAR